MRIIGIDYGERRIGVAVSDETGTWARPLTVIVRKNRKTDMEALKTVVNDQGAQKIVVGLPLRLDGTEGMQCEKVRRFAARLERCLERPVVFWDETLSTAEAEERMALLDVRGRERKAEVDRLAAAVILQGFLDGAGKRAGDVEER